VTVDAVVVGSGPGGATAADVLTAAGWDVVIIEKGRNHLFDPKDPSKLSGDFSNDELKFVNRHFLGPDPLLEPRTFRTHEQQSDPVYVGEVNSIPTTVGGGGVHADGKVPRFREEDFALLNTHGPVEDADVADWPVTYDELEPFYAEAERSVGVAGDTGANPFAAWRSGPYPMPPGAAMYGALLSSASAERLGLHPYAAPTAANSVPYDGRPACNNCGHCAFFGCPIHAKGDPVAMLRRALASGRAELLSDTFAARVHTNGRRATGVEVVQTDGSRRIIDARYVVIAAGAFETPRLLLLSGIDHPLLGRYLMVHFQTFVIGILGERVHAHRGRAVTHVHDDAVIVDDAARAAARQAGLPWIRGGLVEHGGPHLPVMEAKLYPFGPRHKELMRSSPMRDRMWAFTMQGEDLAQFTNRVDLDPSVRDVRGFPVARVTYRPHRHELVASAHHAPRLVQVLEGMGATWTMTATSPSTGGRDRRGVRAVIPMSRHVMGTTRMGRDPRTSVVDPMGRVHGLENLVIADSSVFVTSAGYGPTLTLVALAARAAAALAGVSAPG
jgi:choline dehydrogenase-like flavoprotein